MNKVLISPKRSAASGILAIAASLAWHAPAYARGDCADYFLNPQNRYSHNTAKAAPAPFPLKPGPALGEVTYRLRDDPNTYTLDQYLTKFCTTGFLVLKDDQIVFERYFQGRKPDDSLLSASMSKTILALLMGIAVKDGTVALDERVAAVLPDFKAAPLPMPRSKTCCACPRAWRWSTRSSQAPIRTTRRSIR